MGTIHVLLKWTTVPCSSVLGSYALLGPGVRSWTRPRRRCQSRREGGVAVGEGVAVGVGVGVPLALMTR